jgi:hypothetical protein
MATDDPTYFELHREATALAHRLSAAAEGPRGEATPQLRVAAALALTLTDAIEHLGRGDLPTRGGAAGEPAATGRS